WPMLMIVIAVALAFVYRFGPSRREPKWRWVTWGSATAAVFWVVASLLFSRYAANFGSFNKTYGSLGAVIGFMVWIWVSMIVVLLGAELDAEMEHQTTEDTTTGSAKPMGERRAHMADTVGPMQKSPTYQLECRSFLARAEIDELKLSTMLRSIATIRTSPWASYAVTTPASMR